MPAFAETGFLTIQMSPEYLRSSLSAGQVLIARIEEQVVGYLLLGDIGDYLAWARGRRFDSECNLNSLSEMKYIDQIAVLSAFAKQGIGTALIKEARILSPNGLLTDILLEPYSNPASMAFFTKSGFAHLGVLHIEESVVRPAHQISLMLWKPEERDQ